MKGGIWCMEVFFCLWFLGGVLLIAISLIMLILSIFFRQKYEKEEYNEKIAKWKKFSIISIFWIISSIIGIIFVDEVPEKGIYGVIVLLILNCFILYVLFRKKIKFQESLIKNSDNSVSISKKKNDIHFAEDFKIEGDLEKYDVNFENGEVIFYIENGEIIGYKERRKNTIKYF